MTLTISIASMAPRVGKSTTAVNLAASFALLGFKCILIDCDPGGAASGMIKKGTLHSRQPLYDFLGCGRKVFQTVCNTVVPGLILIPSGNPENSGDTAGLSFPKWGNPFDIALDPFRNFTDVVIFDLPARLDFISVTALAASQGVILPVCDDAGQMGDLRRTLSLIRQINESMYADIQIMGILRTRCRGKEAALWHSAWRSHCLPAVIPEDSVFERARENKIPVCMEDIMTPGAMGYLTAARVVADRFI